MPERPALSAVLLDAGGTIVRIDFEWIAEMLAGLGVSVTAEALRAGELEGRRRFDASARARGAVLGTTDAPRPDGAPHTAPPPDEVAPPLGTAGETRVYFEGILAGAAVPESERSEALARMFERQVERGLWTRAMEGAREALLRLGAMGLRRAVVSNSDGRAAAHLTECGLIELVEFVVDSQVVGVEKPDPRIFRIALERLGVPAERALFVGDIRSVDEVGAAAAGLHFVLIDPTGAYAGPRTPFVRAIGELPEWIESRFDIVPAGIATAVEASRREQS